MKRLHLALLALAVGLIFSFPNWWWQFTLPNYSVVRGYIMADNDLPPYAAALTASADGRPPLTYYLGVYENRNVVDPVPVTLWLTNFLLGNLLGLLGSLELLSAVGLFLSGTAIFLLIYALARGVRLSARVALAAALLACFRYPFYIGLMAAARQLVSAPGQFDAIGLLSSLFPGMVNGWQLYPYLRWPVPGMMYWWFLAALLLGLALAHRRASAEPGRSDTVLIVGAGLVAGLTVFIYIYFWLYLLALFAFLAALGLLAGHRRWLVAMGATMLLALAVGAPLALIQRSSSAVGAATRGLSDSSSLVLGLNEPNAWMGTLAVHGMLAVAVLLTLTLGSGAQAEPASAARSRLRRLWDQAASRARSAFDQPEAVFLFALHGTVVAVNAADVLRFNIQPWHVPRLLLDNLVPITAAWLVVRLWDRGAAREMQPSRRGAGMWALWAVACLALCLVGWGTRRAHLTSALSGGLGLGIVAPAAVLAGRLRRPEAWIVGVLATAVAWPIFHRAFNEMDWVALLPLAVALARLGWPYVRAAGWSLVGLNLLTVVCLQGWVRPALARDFFTVQPGYAEALTWLRQHTPAGSVVATDGWTSDYMVRAYTHDLTLSAVDWWSGMAWPARQRRYLVRTAIYQTSPDVMAQLLAGHEAAVEEFKSDVADRWIGGPEMDALSERQGELGYYNLADYNPLLATPLNDLLHMYRTDYIWVGPWEREMGQRDFISAPEVKLTFDNGLIQIYQVNKEASETPADRRHSQQ
jgi:hypothetical protein